MITEPDLAPTAQQAPATCAVAVSALNLTKIYGEGKTAVRALNGVSVNLQRGEFTAIMGPSGSGKSTLMHCLAGLDTATGGRIFLGGQEITRLKDRELTKVRRDKVGFVFQSFNLLPTLTAAQNILLPLDLAGRKPDPAHFEATVSSLGLQDRLTHRPSELSGGQQQRVAIARALITRPEVIFADEPTGALDSKNGQQLLSQLRTASRELGQTIVMVTHDPMAAAYADRVLLLNDGILVDDLADPTGDTVLSALKRLGPEVLRTAWLEIRHHPNRLLATGLAIMISVGFMAACLVFVATESHAIAQRVTAPTSTSDVIVRLDRDPDGRLQEEIGRLPGVADLASTVNGYADFASPEGSGSLNLESLPTAPFRWSRLTTGSWPDQADQVAIGATTAKAYDLGIGSALTLTDGSERPPRPMRVTGFVDESRSLFGGQLNSAVVDRSFFASLPADWQSPTILVKAAAGVDADQLVGQIRAVVPAESTVITSASESQQALDELTDGTAVFRYLLLVFAAIALLVGAMIIINTFTIIVAQRRRQLGLLRAVGASTTQVRRGLVAEATIIGMLGSIAGVGLGLGIATLASVISGSWTYGLVVPAGQLAIAFGAGVVLTLLASLVPAQRATRVAPLEAMRPVSDAGTQRRATRLRGIIAAALVVGGTAVVVGALVASSNNVVIAVAGAGLLAIGILASAPVFLPRVLRLAGGFTSRSGLTQRLAAANVVRNPGRAAATCTALMLAVGLIVTLQVGAASLKSTTNDSLNSEFPVDVTVTNPVGPLSPTVSSSLAAVPGVKAVIGVKAAEVQIQVPKGSDDPGSLTLAGLPTNADTVVAAGTDRLSDRVALAHHFTIEGMGRKAGDSITLGYQGRKETFTLEASDVAQGGMLVVPEQTLLRLAPDAPVSAVWAAAADRNQAAEVIAGVRKVMGQQSGLSLGGSLEQAAEIDALLDTLLQVATGLLAVAVAIALIGVGNTLGLSVIERTRESALLRALGLQRRQLRLMLMVEAVLLALVGAVVGIGAGMLFGYVGVAALVKETSLSQLRFSMSATQTIAVVLVTCVAGALASVLPGRRAAMAAPTAALAET